MKISAIVLVGLNEPYLKYCIKSIEDIVDEIVFVMPMDIGVKYKTKCKSIHISQEDDETDFSKWRNAALKQCNGDYVLWIDADEILANYDGTPVTRKQLEELMGSMKDTVSIFTYHFLYYYRIIDGRNNGLHFSMHRVFKKQFM